MISNAQTILTLPEGEFVRTIGIYTEMRRLSPEALEWYEAWKEFEEGWFVNPDEPRAEIRTGHYMGWLHSRRLKRMTRKTCESCEHWEPDDAHTGPCKITGMRRGNENTCKEWKKKVER